MVEQGQPAVHVTRRPAPSSAPPGAAPEKPMTREDFLRRLDGIFVWRRDGERAPHKPLLLLLALGRVQRRERRLAPYGNEIAKDLKSLLRRFGRPRSVLHPEAPFARLRRDGLWEVVTDKDLDSIRGKGGITHGQLVDHAAAGGFPASDQRLLLGDPALVEEAAQRLLDCHFAPSLHDDIRDAVGLTRPSEQRFSAAASSRRDPRFRHSVLRAYERRCAACGFDVRLDDDLVGLDAAHIRWHSEGGPDDVRNGLALCILHHRIFDRGAIGLERAATGFRLVVSDEVNGQSPAFRQLLDCHGRPLRSPQRARQHPNPDFVDWHRRQVFRGEPRERSSA